MNVRMMPPQGPMGQPMPQGGSPAPMGGPPPMPMGGPGTFPVGSMPVTAGKQNTRGLGSTFGGNAEGRGQFKNFMSEKKKTSAFVPQMPMAPAMSQLPMLPPPMPTNMGAMKPMGAPNMGGGAPQLGRQAPVGGGIGSAPMGVASNTNAVRGFADGGSVPRQTEIAGQPHYLAYINPEEGDILKGLGGAEAPGPGGIPSYFFHSGWGGGGSTSTSSNDDDDDGGFSFSDWASDTWAEITSGGEAVTETYNSGDAGGGGQDNNPNAGDGGGTSGGYSGDEFGSGNIYTETTPGASTVNFGNDDDDPPAPTPYSYVDTSNIAGISAASGVDYNPTANDDDNSLDPFGGAGDDISDDYVTNDGGISYTYDPIVSGGTGTTTAGTGGYEGSTYDEVPDVGAGTELDTTLSDYENEAYGGAIEDYYNLPPSNDGENDVYVPPADPEPPAPPPVYYDAVGNAYGSQAEASAADAAAEAAQQQAIDIASQSDGQAGYTVGGYDYQGPDYTAPDVDTGPSQYEIDASNNTAKLMNDYSVISDDYSNFQGIDLTTQDANTIGYATGGSKAGYSAVINPSTGGIDILTPGSQGVERSFAATELEDALNFLTDGDIDLTLLDAPLDLLPEASGGTGTVGLDAEGRLIEYGTEDIGVGATDDDLATDFTTVSTGVGATDDDLATDFSTVSTDTEKDLAFQDYLDGLVDTDFTDPELTGLEALEGDISDLPDNIQKTNILSDFDISELEVDAEDFMNSFDGKTEDELIADQGIIMPSDEAFARAEEDMSGLDTLAEAALAGDTDDDDDEDTGMTDEVEEAAQEVLMASQPTASELYLSAMGKIGRGISDLDPEEQRALYGARGQTPNAAETAYLQSLLRDAKHTSDGPIDEREYITSDGDVIANPNYKKPMYEAGDSVAKQTLGETAEDFLIKAFDILVNPLTIFGDDYSLEGANARNVQAQLDAYKNGGTFVYGEDGKTVVGVAQPNFDADNDGKNDTVVIVNEDGDIQVTGDAIGVEDIKTSNDNADGEDLDIDVVDSSTTFTNTEDGVVEGSTYDDIVAGGDDSGADPCPEGFYLDPVTGICMPMDDIGDVGDTSGGGISIGGITRGSSDYITSGVPSDVKGLKITKPKQFNRGGMVSPNIDRFIQSLAS